VVAASINPNPVFADYPTTGLPTDYSSYATPTISRQGAGLFGPYAMRVASSAGINAGAYLPDTVAGLSDVRAGYFVIEADVVLISGSLVGAGVLFRSLTAGGVSTVDNLLTFATDPDSNGDVVGAGETGRVYHFRKLVRITAADARKASLWAMAHWSTLGSIAAANSIDFHRLLVRPATAEEILANTVIPPLQATVTEHSSAIATIEGYLEARWEVGAAVPGAEAFISAVAVVDGESEPTSSVAIGAQVFSVFNASGDEWLEALKVVGGNVILSGGLQAGAFIRLGSGAGWPVALQSKDFTIADGTAVSFGTDLGQVPALSFSTVGLAPLTSGETYNLYADSLTPTGFTARLKINTPGTPSSVSLTTDTTPGSGPTRQIDKGANPDATGNEYTLKGSVSATFRVADRAFGELIDYSGSVTLGVWAKVSGVWSEVGTMTCYLAGETVGTGAFGDYLFETESGEISDSFIMSAGVEAFGLTLKSHAGTWARSLDDFDSVTYSTPGSPSGTRSATPAGQTSTVTVRPKN
jgi:hypothetical protein